MSKIKIRRMKVGDIPEVADILFDLSKMEKRKGNKTLSPDDDVVKGGLLLQLGSFYQSQDANIQVAEQDDKIIAVLAAAIMPCRPYEDGFNYLYVWFDYLKNSNLASARALDAMWKKIKEWAVEAGVIHAVAHILPGNTRSIQVVKKVGFKHHYTQFHMKLVEEEESDGLRDGSDSHVKDESVQLQ